MLCFVLHGAKRSDSSSPNESLNRLAHLVVFCVSFHKHHFAKSGSFLQSFHLRLCVSAVWGPDDPGTLFNQPPIWGPDLPSTYSVLPQFARPRRRSLSPSACCRARCSTPGLEFRSVGPVTGDPPRTRRSSRARWGFSDGERSQASPLFGRIRRVDGLGSIWGGALGCGNLLCISEIAPPNPDLRRLCRLSPPTHPGV